ncbi:rod shape-determining protein RodA [Hirschia baltica]|uniref:Peptidoglycan glycosyltransferase MrdB n=1 Tax=Hirschia baltica (strain ATCC 49814 / DSM 5838 / IFAM 1418) TaxID=582402 RepID=C6XN17_HIRBI|nr:rod shape-determining protein RodA [Hirschia baltica]ACT58187.1 rod shape-determining protein RodA [Hirschia baltica ATCC 49814]
MRIIAEKLTLIDKLRNLHWSLLLTFIAIASFGTAVLVSVTLKDPSMADIPWQHITRFVFVLLATIGLALAPIRLWAMIAYPLYLGALFLLVLVELFGTIGGGAQRWLDIGPVLIQPSEFMKIAILLALARYYHQTSENSPPNLWNHIMAGIIIIVPTILVLKQPDLGTSLMLAATGGVVIFCAGLSWKIIIAGILGVLLSIWPVYQFGLKDYQKERVYTFLDPSRDPLGAGYQLQQAKIAIGSGGLQGKGFMQGTQSQNNYIPEQHTDFIFTIIAEEFGFVGSMSLLTAWAVALIFGLLVGNRSTTVFGALAAAGVVATLAFYVVVNIGMVMGLMPVVGVPLPLISHGGTAMMTVMLGFSILLMVHIHRDQTMVLKGVL